jgi:4-oxalocrotonate tautomerase
MPEVHVFAAAGRTVDQKRALAREITDAVARNFDTTPDAVTVQFIESPRDSKAKGGVLFSDRPS